MAPYDSDSDSDSNVDDIGRLQSENLMQQKPKKAYLANVLEQADLDYNEVMELIERERKILDSADQNFLSSLDLAFHDKALEKVEDSCSSHDRDYKYDSNSRWYIPQNDRIRDMGDLLHASDVLLQLHGKAGDAMTTAMNITNENWTAHLRALATDRKHVKKVLAAGKRVVEREIDGHDADDERAGDEARDDSVMTQAEALFDGDKKGSTSGRERSGKRKGKGNLERELKRVEKGVKTMVKGLDAV